MVLFGKEGLYAIAWIVAQNKLNPQRPAETICFFCNFSFSILGILLHANKKEAALGYFSVTGAKRREHAAVDAPLSDTPWSRYLLGNRNYLNFPDKSRVLAGDRSCLEVATQSFFPGRKKNKKRNNMRSKSAERGEASGFQRELQMRFPRRGVSRSQTQPAKRPACSLHNVLIPSSHWNLMTN